MAFILSIVIFVLYCWLVINYSKSWLNTFKKQTILFKILYFSTLILPGLLIVILLKDERYIYFWDNSGYWIKAIRFNSDFFSNPFSIFDKIYESINHDEYNIFPNLFPTIINKIFGLDFAGYFFSNYIVFFIPLSFIFSNLCIKVLEIKKSNTVLLLPFICILFTPFLIPLRFGMLDIIGLIPIFIILNILVDNDYLKKKMDVKTSVIIGILLLLLLFTRRWYTFWVVAFFPSLFLINLFYSIRHKDYKIILVSSINLFISGAFLTIVLLIFFYPYFEMSFLKDYKDIYSAYRRQGPWDQIRNFLNFYGIIIIAFSLIGVYFLTKKNKYLSSFLILSTLFIILLFTKINNFSTLHHFYLVTPFLSVFAIFGFFEIAKKQKWVIVLFILVLSANNYVVFMHNLPSKFSPFSKISGEAKIREDFSTINEISDYLIRLQEDGSYVYCLASSYSISDAILKNTKLPDINAIPALFTTQHVDKRDQFPNNLFLANYVVVTDPVQLHLGEENQYLVGYLNNQILNGFLTNHYKTVKDYTIEKGIKVYIKKRLSAPTKNDIQEIKNFFKSKYPEYPNMYQLDEYLSQISSLKKGDAYGKINFENGNLVMNPGSERSSEISFSLDSTKNYQISFKAGFRNKEELIKNCNSQNDGEVNLTIYTNSHLYNKSYITHRKDSIYNISLSYTKEVRFEVDKGKNEDWCDWFQLSDFKITQK